jgi:hypothetical protein
MASAALIASAATSTGGIAALVVNKFRNKKSKCKENQNGQQQDRVATPESRVPARVA